MSEATTINLDVLRSMPLPQYGEYSSKADYGKLLIIAGSARLPGAALLAARAALRSGCGTVRLAAPKSVALAIGIAMPELMVLPLPETETGTLALEALSFVEEQFAGCDAAVLGPGLDANDETDELIRKLIAKIPLPTVIDAQALYAIGETANFGAELAPRVWTPHEGELHPILGRPFSEIELSREEFAVSFARDRASVLALKGRETLISTPAGGLWKNTAGTRGMGTAGSGDTLSGIIGSLLAQGMEAGAAAAWGVHIHALAGEAAGEDLGDDGMLASDLVQRIPNTVRYLRKGTENGKNSVRTGLRPTR